MRILHVLDHSIPLQSGYTFRTLAILAQQRSRGWETFHLTGPKQMTASPEETIQGWHFYRTAPTPRWLALPVVAHLALMQRLARRLTDVVRTVRPDVLHAHSPVLDAIPALHVGKRFGIPVVYEVRAFWEDAAADHGTAREGSLRYRATRALETYALRRATAVTTICEGLRRDIVGRGISPEKVTVIPNAVDANDFKSGAERDADLAATLGLQGGRVLGFIGSFYAYEGLAVLLDAMPAILAQAPDVKVLLVGGGPEEARLRNLVGRAGLAGRVIFTGRVPHEQISRYYDQIDLLVYPRRSMRLTDLVTPLKPLEAMAQGRLVLASDVGGHRELIAHGETGMLFAADDPKALSAAALALLADRGSWARLRANARRYVERERNWPLSVARYEEVYARALARAVPA